MGWWETSVSWHPTYPTLPNPTGPKRYFAAPLSCSTTAPSSSKTANTSRRWPTFGVTVTVSVSLSPSQKLLQLTAVRTCYSKSQTTSSCSTATSSCSSATSSCSNAASSCSSDTRRVPVPWWRPFRMQGELF